MKVCGGKKGSEVSGLGGLQPSRATSSERGEGIKKEHWQFTLILSRRCLSPLAEGPLAWEPHFPRILSAAPQLPVAPIYGALILQQTLTPLHLLSHFFPR